MSKMINSFREFFTPSKESKSKKQTTKRTLQLEPLETREMLSVAPLGTGHSIPLIPEVSELVASANLGSSVQEHTSGAESCACSHESSLAITLSDEPPMANASLSNSVFDDTSENEDDGTMAYKITAYQAG